VKNRIEFEIEYWKRLVSRMNLNEEMDQYKDQIGLFLDRLLNEYEQNFAFTTIKKLEFELKHDVKAVEVWIRNQITDHFGRSKQITNLANLIHFGLTSHDVNNVALKLQLQRFDDQYLQNKMDKIIHKIEEISKKWINIKMLGFTHGQVASPTFLGKEMFVFWERLKRVQLKMFDFKWYCKLGGATGNLSAHKLVDDEVMTYDADLFIDWESFFADFAMEKFGMIRNEYTTQVDHWDDVAEYFQLLSRFNSILIDLCRDIWMYVSKHYFKYKCTTKSVGSSTMPHKVNPIHFENSEGNLLLSNSILNFLAQQIPLSRMQRDLVNSTLYRNFGVAIGYSWLAYETLLDGLDKLDPDLDLIRSDLNSHYEVLAEGAQTLLKIAPFQNSETDHSQVDQVDQADLGRDPKKQNDPILSDLISSDLISSDAIPSDPYTFVKEKFRGHNKMSKDEWIRFSDLICDPQIRSRLCDLTPSAYIQ
jgi:adenylosuccinate lyase